MAFAMPPYPDSNFSRITRTYLTSIQSEIDVPSEINISGIKDFNLLVLCVYFQDKWNNTSAKYFDSLVFNDNFGTMKDWYKYESYGKFNLLKQDSIFWTIAPQLYSYYVNNDHGFGDYPNNTQKLVEDLIDSVDQFIDFSKYDNDRDGVVDGLIIVHAGQGAELTRDKNDIWSHKWAVHNPLKDGVTIHDYCTTPEYWLTPNDMAIGVYCHEFGHMLGLPDLYDTDGSSNGIGRWSVMSSGSWNGVLGSSPSSFDPWCRIKLGFSHEENCYGSQSTTILPSNSDSMVTRLWENGFLGNYYYLLENRLQKSYDTFSPSQGLLIWKIDETKPDNRQEWYPETMLPVHQNLGNYHIALVQADNSYDLERRRNIGDPYDTYPNIFQEYSEFTHRSIPNSDWYNGDLTSISIINIIDLDSTIKCDISVETNTSIAGEKNDIIDYFSDIKLYRKNNNYTIYSTNVDAKVSCEVFNILGQTVKNLESDKNFVEWYPSKFLPRGVYFAMSRYQFRGQNFIKTFKITL